MIKCIVCGKEIFSFGINNNNPNEFLNGIGFVAIHDEKGAHNKFKGYSGKGFVTELGKKYLEN
jgi:hypothetical protein